MTRFRITFATLIVLSCSWLTGAQTNYPTIDSFLKSTLTTDDALSTSAKGDLNADGREDWVGVVHGQKPESAPTYQLFVLLQNGNGGYELAEKSQKAEIPGMGCCWLEDLEIRGGSIFIQNNAKTAATMEAAIHQFKFYKGDWRLLGLKIYLTDHTPWAPRTVDTDMNILTGAVIEKTQKGKKRPVTKRQTKKFPVSLLKDFDFFNGFGVE